VKNESTPHLTPHARDRCLEMGISTKRAKRVVQQQVLKYVSNAAHDNGAFIVMSHDADIAVVWQEDRNLILSVLHRTQEVYERP
jgi:predicted nucleotide-binding protein